MAWVESIGRTPVKDGSLWPQLGVCEGEGRETKLERRFGARLQKMEYLWSPEYLCVSLGGMWTELCYRMVDLASVFKLTRDQESLELLRSQHLLNAYCVQAKSLATFLLFIPCTPSVRWVLLLALFLGWESQSLERFRNLRKVTWAVIGGTEI